MSEGQATSSQEIGSLRELSVRLRWWIHGQLHQLRESLKSHMEENERGPRDYAPSAEEIARLRRRPYEIGVVHESGGGNNSGGAPWQTKLLIGVGIAVASSAIVEAMVTWRMTSIVSTQLTDYIKSNDEREARQDKEMEEMRSHLYRGAQ